MSETWSIRADGETVTVEASPKGYVDLGITSDNGGAGVRMTRDELVALVQTASTALEVMDRKGRWSQ